MKDIIDITLNLFGMFLGKKYLEGRKRVKGRSIIVRYKCENETRQGQYWREEEVRRCRICQVAEKGTCHVLTECE